MTMANCYHHMKEMHTSGCQTNPILPIHGSSVERFVLQVLGASPLASAPVHGGHYAWYSCGRFAY